MSVVSPVVGSFFIVFVFVSPLLVIIAISTGLIPEVDALLHCCQEEFRLVHWWVRILVGIPWISSICSYKLGFLGFFLLFFFVQQTCGKKRDVNSQTWGNLEPVYPECGSENEDWKTKPPNCSYPAVECWLYRSLPPFRAWPLTLRNCTLLWVRVRHSLKVWQTSGHLQAEKQQRLGHSVIPAAAVKVHIKAFSSSL